MSKEEIPSTVQRFVLTSVPSVPFLEGLLLLRSAPGAAWDAREVSRRLYLPEPRVRDLLSDLQQAGFLVAASADCYRYAPEPELAARVDELHHWYSIRLLDITMLIHSTIDKRAQQFADAFRWKRGD